MGKKKATKHRSVVKKEKKNRIITHKISPEIREIIKSCIDRETIEEITNRIREKHPKEKESDEDKFIYPHLDITSYELLGNGVTFTVVNNGMVPSWNCFVELLYQREVQRPNLENLDSYNEIRKPNVLIRYESQIIQVKRSRSISHMPNSIICMMNVGQIMVSTLCQN